MDAQIPPEHDIEQKLEASIPYNNKHDFNLMNFIFGKYGNERSFSCLKKLPKIQTTFLSYSPAQANAISSPELMTCW